MNIKQRIDLLVKLGNYFGMDDEKLRSAKEKASLQNPWFSMEFIDLSIKNITENFLQKDLLETWVKDYHLPDEPLQANTVGIVMAGNIPLVGFHDLLCVFVSGHKAMIKPSSKDDVLIKHIAQKFFEWDDRTKNLILFADILKNCDAYIATGSNNSSRYFEYYFRKYPNIIRCNRTSVAVLDGTETEEELSFLADDIQLYYGLGCRNVTKVFVPENYDFVPLLRALKKYSYFADFHKYRNNYDYQLALLIMNRKFYMTNESVILTENESLFSPVSQVNYEVYSRKDSLKESLANDKNIQCIAGHDFIPFGETQSPALSDYADRVDTMQFLKTLPGHEAVL
jgi:hypothetical protein